LKQGRTGARKTWPAAELLLDYLVLKGGLLSGNSQSASEDVLDLTGLHPQYQSLQEDLSAYENTESFNIVELGAGTGYLGVGLAMALNKDNFRPKVRLLCTDHDTPTIKNMRYNISDQPRDRKLQKAVRAEILDWGEDVGGSRFSDAVERQFRQPTITTITTTSSNNKELVESNDYKVEDPIRLLTHLIAADVHWGGATLDPLSSVISGIKLRNPNIAVIILLQERNPNAVAQLKSEIARKVQVGREAMVHTSALLDDFSVRVRDVMHDHVGLSPTDMMKVIEC
jgi:hypothetical protein